MFNAMILFDYLRHYVSFNVFEIITFIHSWLKFYNLSAVYIVYFTRLATFALLNLFRA